MDEWLDFQLEFSKSDHNVHKSDLRSERVNNSPMQSTDSEKVANESEFVDNLPSSQCTQ